jgi:hypothetical protein
MTRAATAPREILIQTERGTSAGMGEGRFLAAPAFTAPADEESTPRMARLALDSFVFIYKHFPIY